MRHLPLKVTRRGQGLVEYALVLALVALVAILAIGLLGLANARGYGVVAGALGAQRAKDVSPNGDWYLYFDPDQLPRCGRLDNDTVLFGKFYSDVEPKYLTVSTDNGFVTTGIDLDTEAGVHVGADVYDYTNHLSIGTPDNTKCPHSLVMQSDKAHGGLIIVYPVEIRDWTTE